MYVHLGAGEPYKCAQAVRLTTGSVVQRPHPAIIPYRRFGHAGTLYVDPKKQMTTSTARPVQSHYRGRARQNPCPFWTAQGWITAGVCQDSGEVAGCAESAPERVVAVGPQSCAPRLLPALRPPQCP